MEESKIRLPKKKQIHEKILILKKENVLKSGAVFNKEMIEMVLGVPYKKDDWNWIGPFMNLVSVIESEGFFITQRDMEYPSFRVLESREMAEHAEKKLVKNMLSNFKIAYVLAAHDTSILKDEERKNHEYIQKKAARTALFQQKMMMSDQQLEVNEISYD